MKEIEKKFKEVFGVIGERIYSAPGRINLIGEHIDYNGGLVLPAAVSRRVKACIRLRDDKTVRLSSTAFEGITERGLKDLAYDVKYGWANYVFGTIDTLGKKGYKTPQGFDMLVDSNLPLASGLSSSAALLVLTAFALSDLFGFNLTKREIASVAFETENGYCGLKCGIMDQAAIALGKRDKCLLLDCSDFSYDYCDLKLDGYTFAVLSTNKKRKLTESKYNQRVEECEAALGIIRRDYKEVNAVCELTSYDLAALRYLIKDQILLKRIRHCITENERVKDFVAALKRKDVQKLGEILKASHKSLKEDYEVTGFHLDTIVGCANIFGALGARMTGAGFGGSAIALVKKDDFESMREEVTKYYRRQTGITPDIFAVTIAEGPKKEK